MLRRMHIGMGSDSDGRSARGLMAQAHEANFDDLGGIVCSASDDGDGNNNSNY